MNKVYTLHDAVAKFVEDGDCISFGGFTTTRKPYAAARDILRQRPKACPAWSGPAGGACALLHGHRPLHAYMLGNTDTSAHPTSPPPILPPL